MNINIFKIDRDKIYAEFWYQTYYKGNKIIFLMSQKTLDFIKNQMIDSVYLTKNKDGDYQLFYRNIAIANYLSYGDIKIVNEC